MHHTTTLYTIYFGLNQKTALKSSNVRMASAWKEIKGVMAMIIVVTNQTSRIAVITMIGCAKYPMLPNNSLNTNAHLHVHINFSDNFFLLYIRFSR